MNLPPKIRSFVDEGALFVLNDSGGKDSQAMRIALRGIVPAAQMIVIHASLGEVEWPGALEHAKAGAERNGLRFFVVRAGKTLLGMVEQRHADRPDVPCWPSAACRQCTSDLKRDPIARFVRHWSKAAKRFLIVNCTGIRAEESAGRAKQSSLRRNERNSKAGREWWDWLPIHAWTRAQVFAAIAEAGETPHQAYALGNERLSCMFCVMGSRNDLAHAARANPDLYRRYVEMERRTGYTMHQSRIPLPVLTGVPVPPEREVAA